jgi:hypothetical protein
MMQLLVLLKQHKLLKFPQVHSFAMIIFIQADTIRQMLGAFETVIF